MAANDNPLQILVTAQLDKKISSDTIKKQLDSISKNVGITLDTKSLQKVQKQLNDLQKIVDKQKIKVNVDTSEAKKQAKVMEDQLNQSLKDTVNKLNKQYNNKVDFSKIYNTQGAEDKLEKLVAKVTDAQGKIKTLTFAPKTKEGFTELEQVSERIVTTNDKVDTLRKNLVRTIDLLYSTNKISVNQKDNFINSANVEKSATGLRNLKTDMSLTVKENKALNDILKQTGENAQKATQGIKNKAEADAKEANSALDATQNEKKKNEVLKQQIADFQRLQGIRLDNLNNRFDGFSKLDPSYASKLNEIRKNLDGLNNISLNKASRAMKEISMQTKELGSQAEIAGGRVMTLGDSMKHAISGITQWAVAGTAVYGTLHALQDTVKTIIDVDTQMTQLKRVMNSGTDYTSMLQQMLNLSRELGRSFDDVATNAQEFAKQGFDQTQVIALTKVATLLQNISDLSPQESMDALMSGIQNFGIQASESLKVANMLNETDNQYSISTQQLAQSMAKAGSTAKAYHVSLSSVIGATTAVGSATRESGSVIGNFLKTLYARLETMPKSVAALKSIGISVKDNSGQMKSASKVLGELHDRWSTLSDAQKQYVGLSLGGLRQLNRVYALLNNYNLALKAQATAEDSAGSAQRENSRYMDSYQAKINQMKAAWEELQIAMGKALIGNSLVASVSALTKLGEASAFVVKNVGLLPVVFGGISTALLLMNKSFRKSATEEISFSAITKGLTISMDALKVSMRGLLVASGVGLVFAGIGFALEKLIDVYSDYQAQQAKVQKQVSSETSSYRKHSDEIDHLVSRYKELSSASKNGALSSADSQEYEDVQNRLNKLLPSVTDHIDKENNAHLKSVEVVSSAVSEYQKLSKAKSDAIVADLPSNLNKVNKEIDKAKNSLQELKASQNIKGNLNDATNWKVTVPASPDDTVKNLNEQVIVSSKLQQAQNKLKTTMKDFASAYVESKDASDKLTNADKSYISSLVDQNSKELKTRKEQEKLQNQITDTTNGFIKFRKELGKDLPTKSISDLVSSIQGINVKKISGNRTLIEAKKDVHDLADAYKNGEITSKQFVAALKEDGVSSKNASKAQKQMAKDIANASDKAKGQSKVLVDLVHDLDDTEKVTKDLNKALNNDHPDSDQMKRAIGVFQVLNKLAEDSGGKAKLSAYQQQMLSQAYETLYSNFPKYVKNGKVNIEMIQQEIKSSSILDEAVQKAVDGTITAEQATLLAKAQATKKRIELIQAEIDAMDAYAEAYKEFMARTEDSYNEMDDKNQLIANKVAMRLQQQAGGADSSEKIKKAKEELDSLGKVETSTLGKLKSSMDKSSSSTDKASKSVTKYKYTHDKLAESLAKVNSQIQILTDKTSRYDQASAKYRSSISKEISLLKQKNDILKAQEKSLEQQIKTGNIISYGESSTTSTTSGGSSSSVSGGSTAKSWTNAIKSAAQEMGVKLTEAGLNAVIKRIQQESGGSETVFNMWDSNAKAGHPSRGLLQYIPSTFNAYKVKGHGNILSGYDQLLAMFNDPNWYRDISRSGGWGPTGNRRTTTASGGGSSSSTSETIGKAEADQQAAIVQAKQNLYDLQQQIIDNENAIQQAYLDLVNSHITQYDNRIKTLDSSVAKYDAKAQAANPATKAYRADVNKEISLSKDKQKEQQKEIDYINKQIKSNKNLNSAQKADLKSQLADKKADLQSTKDAIKQFYADIATSNITHYENISNTIDVTISKYQQLASAAKENSKAEVDAIRNEETATNKKLANQEKELAYINKQISSNKNLTAAVKRDLRSQAESLQSNIYSTQSSLKDLADSVKQIYQTVADNITDAMKDMYQKQIDAAQKAHDKQVNLYDDQQKKYDEMIQKQIDAIDKQDDDESYAQQLQDAQKAVTDLQKQYNNFLMDTSTEGKAKAKDLANQMADAQKELDDLQKQHDSDTRKQALQDQQDSYDDSIDQQKTALDDKMSAYEDAMNNIINDDTKWTNLQNQILEGHYADILNDFNKFSDEFKKSSGLLGSGITNSLLAKIKELAQAVQTLGLTSGGSSSLGNINIPSFDVGGYTGDNVSSKGMFSLLHKGEWVLNDQQQKNLIGSMISGSKNAYMSAIAGLSNMIQLPQVNTVNNTSQSSGDISITIENMTIPNTDQDGVTKFMNTIANNLKGMGVRVN